MFLLPLNSASTSFQRSAYTDYQNQKKVYNGEIQISYWHTHPAFLLPLLYFNIRENVRTVLKKIGELINYINETWLQQNDDNTGYFMLLLFIQLNTIIFAGRGA